MLSGARNRRLGKGNPEVHGGMLPAGPSFQGLRGLGQLGADFWPVLEGPHGNKPIFDEGYYTVSQLNTVQFLLAPGKDGPVPSRRYQMLREAVQEAEARITVQEALLDPAAKARLGPDLAARAEQLCYDRSQWLRHISEYWAYNVNLRITAPGDIQRRSRALYDLAGEIGLALGAK
jgi:hypothetical protein